MASFFSSREIQLYKYSPLGHPTRDNAEFRLITLQPGRQGSPIRCDLHHVPIHAPPLYEALSYTWGDPKGPKYGFQFGWQMRRFKTIWIKGQPVDVTFNLEAALQRIRSDVTTKVLWADAICIDQSNSDEKSEQVQLMATIYRQASRVLCWLGERDRYTDLAFDSLQELCWAIKARIWQYCSTRLSIPISQVNKSVISSLFESDMSSSSWERSPLRALDNPKLFESFMSAFALIPIDFSSCRSLSELAVITFGRSRTFARSLLSDSERLTDTLFFLRVIRAIVETFHKRSYWKRAWIVQEILHAREAKILCEDRWIDSRISVILAIIMFKRGSVLIPAFDTVEAQQMIQLTVQYLSPFIPAEQLPESLAERLFLYGDRTSSEPRDSIYALLNISKPINITPDYKKPVQDVYTDATRSIIRQEKNLDIIYWALFASSSILPLEFNLSSWVPHFNLDLLPRNCRQRSDPIDEAYLSYCSLSDTEIESTLSVAENRVLRVTGCFYGTITGTTPRIPLNLFHDDLNDLDDACWPVDLPYKESFKSHLDFARAILTDKYFDDSERDIGVADSDDALFYLIDDLLKFQTTDKVPNRLKRALKFLSSGKTLCITSKTDKVMILGNAKVGDHVFFARGAINPFILRPTSIDCSYLELGRQGSSFFWLFVGIAYVHGMTDNVILEKMADGTLVEEHIYLI